MDKNILIKNNAKLNYSDIGVAIDFIQDKNPPETLFASLIEMAICDIGDKRIKVQIRYMKKYNEWIFDEID